MSGNTSVLTEADHRCDACIWWRHVDTGRVHNRVGTCHRMPPSARMPFDDVAADRAREGIALWPRMRSSDWCGEFTGKVE